jgi:uncharacterized protein YhdP
VIRKTTKWLLRITAGIATGVVVLLALGFWRLLQGPVPLDFALPYLQDSIAASDSSVRFDAREVTLNWAGWDRTLEVRVGSLQAIGANGETIATVPRAAVNLSMLALLSGEIAPTEIQLEKLRLHVVLGEDGRVDLGNPNEQEAGGRFLGLLIDQLLTRDEQTPLISRLERVVVTGAEIVFEDRKQAVSWRSPNAELVLARDEKGVLGEAAIEIEALGQRAMLNVRALFSRDDRSFAVAINFDGVRPSVLAMLDPKALDTLAQIDLAFGGTIDAKVSARGKIESMTVNIASGPGTIGALGIFPETRTVRRSAMRGEVNIENGTLRIDGLTVDFGDTRIEGKGEGAIAGGNVSFGATIYADRVATQDLAKFWPPAMSRGGRGWTLANVEGGQASNLSLKFDFTGDINTPDSIKFSNISGGMEFAGLTVHYLRPMPPVQGVGGTMSLNESSVRFNVKSGALNDITLAGATITLSNLDKPTDHRAHIDVTANSSLAAQLRLLDHPRVGMPRDLVIRPERVSGQVATRVILELPLIDTLSMAQIEYSASATTSGVSIKDVTAKVDLTDAALAVQLNGREMDIRGRGKIAGQTADLVWRVNFGRAAYFRRYEIKSTFDAADLARIASIELPQVKGPVGMQTIMTEPVAGTGTVSMALDLKQATVEVPEIGWRKPAGRDAGARIAFDIRGEKPGEKIEMEIAASDMQAQGTLVMAANGSMQRVDLSRLVFGRNNLRGSWARSGDGYAVVLAGTSLDVAPFLEEQTKPGDVPPADGPAAPLRGPIYDITLDLRQVLTKRGKLDGATGRLRLQDGRMVSADITGRTEQGTMIRALVSPKENGRRLSVETSDTGAMLKSLGWLEGMFGGQLQLHAEYDDTRTGSPLRGTLRIGEYKLIKTPVVGDVLSVAPLTDALSAFSSSGLEFDRLQAPFAWHRGVLTLNNARTAGSSLGLTATGRINTNNDTVQIEGVIVPAYVLNNLIGNIPLIGPLITGGQGGGIFAINYAVEGPVAKPTVSTNPLSALAPGFLRNLFGAGSGEDVTADPAPAPAPSQPTPLTPPPPQPAEQLRQ